ncbi:hypothetical protein [Oceanithermus sp.]
MSSDANARKEPFPGAYYLGLIITVSVLMLLVVITSALPPGAAGATFAFFLGLTVSPRYVPWFALLGVFAAFMGFAGREPMVAWGGIGLVVSQAVVYYWNRQK